MRRAIKGDNSRIVTEELKYKPQNSTNNRKIAEILWKEQKGFCAYTNEYISRTDARDIEHFNPTLKGTDDDHYSNWFLVKHQWNLEKKNWIEFQPVLHPTADKLEDRIVYWEGDYFVKTEADTEAVNLLKLLKLDDPELAEKRKKYIRRRKEDIAIRENDPLTYFINLISDNECEVSYPRAIKEEFGVDILQILD